MDLLERAYQLFTVTVADEPYDGGVHPNDYRAAKWEWIADYEREQNIAEVQEIVDRIDALEDE